VSPKLKKRTFQHTQINKSHVEHKQNKGQKSHDHLSKLKNL
jgi:hypothetical protein